MAGQTSALADKIGGRSRKASEKASWDRHTQAQIGGPKPQTLNPEVFGIRTCGAGKLAMERKTTT